jgi:hypothetical protein
MVQPINYMPAQPVMPGNILLQADSPGATIRAKMMQDAQAAEAARAQQEAQQFIMGVMGNPNASLDDFGRVLALNPKMKESVELLASKRSEAENRATTSHALQVASAIDNKRLDVAEMKLMERAQAMEAAGQVGAVQQARQMVEALKADPTQNRNAMLAMVAAAPGGKDSLAAYFTPAEDARKAAEEGRRVAMSGPALREAEAKATTAEVEAKYAGSKTLLDLEQKGWNIEALKADIGFKREANRIAAINAGMAREGNDLRRADLELKIAEARSALDGKAREKAAEAANAASQVDNMLNTVERIRKNPSLNGVLGTIQGRMPVLLSDEAADAVALIDNLGSQAFLAQIPAIKGLGQLSNVEGDKLQQALQNMTRVQSEKQFRENLTEAQRLLKKARNNIGTRLGVPMGPIDTPAAPRAAGRPAGSNVRSQADAILSGGQ